MDAPEGDFTVTVKVKGAMTHNYNSASIGIYANNTSVIQMARRFHTGLAAKVEAVPSKLGSVGNVIDFMTRTNSYNEIYVADTQFAAPLWMRITRVGDVFHGYYSYDGVHFTEMPGTQRNAAVAACTDLKIVLACHVGGSETYVMDIDFEDLTVNGELIPFTKSAKITSQDVNLSDIRTVLESVANGEYLLAADTDRDGTTSLMDVIKLLKKIVK